MYPLRFAPIFQRYVWGGRRLADILGKPIGDQAAAESWELVDHPDAQSVVQYGPLAGRTLHELLVEYDTELIGTRVWQQVTRPELPPSLQLRFPLLLKFLDATSNLSVQVHPDDSLGRQLKPPDLGKTEAWYVLHADPGAKVYAGLLPGVTRTDFQRALAEGTTDQLLHCFTPAAGDCILVAAGTVHAIGAGLLIAEIQQASNTTFRVFDWNRVDDQGRARPLHLEQAMQAIDFDRGPVDPVRHAASPDRLQTLTACQQFTLDRILLTEPVDVGGDNEFRILTVARGSILVDGDPTTEPLTLGQTVLIPACLGPVTLRPVGGPADALLIAAGR